MSFIRTTFITLSLLSLFIQAESCRKKPEQGSPAPSPTPVVSPTRSATPNRTTTTPSTTNSGTTIGTSLPEGIWGGQGIALQVTSSGAEVEFDCAHGVINKPLHIGADGSFEIAGTFVPEGGPSKIPVSGVTKEKAFSATYRGLVKGEQMTLDVSVAETGANLHALSLVRGRPATLQKCY